MLLNIFFVVKMMKKLRKEDEEMEKESSVDDSLEDTIDLHDPIVILFKKETKGLKLKKLIRSMVDYR